MEIINDFLRGLSAETRSSIWYSFIAIFALLFILFTAYYTMKTVESKKKSFISAVIVISTYVVVLIIAFAINKLTNEFIGISGNIYFLPGVVLCAITLKKYLGQDFMDTLDIVTIAFLFARPIHLFGCLFSGCCQGNPVKWGVYSAISKTTVIPVNEMEALFLFTAWIFLNRYYQKNNYEAHGKVATYGFIAFGAISFVSDVFTTTIEKIFFMTSLDGLVPFITMCVGLVLLYIITKKTNHNSADAENAQVDSLQSDP